MDANKLKKNLRLFPYINGSKLDAEKLQIDDESLIYITIREFAQKITNIIIEHLQQKNIDPYNTLIVDATAGVGGNAISFALSFKKVVGIEIDKMRSEYLMNNINVYKLGNIDVINDNCLNVVYKLEGQYVIFFDPPWGGKIYKSKKNIKLSIGNIDIEDICNNVFDRTITKCPPVLVVLKLPINYDIKTFYERVGMNNKKIIYYNLLNKMIILVIYE